MISKKQIMGFYVLIIGLSIILKTVFPGFKLIYFFFAFLIIISIHLIIKALSSTKSKKLIVPGVTLLLLSLFLKSYFLFLYRFVEFRSIWPILGLFPAIGLILYYIISCNKNPATIIPGIFISILSIILLLITTHVFKLKFINFIIIVLAGMFVITGLYLIFYNEISIFKKLMKNDGKNRKKK
jgi:hypothetical protein